MEKIASFTIDHIKLEPGVYVSRKDTVGAEVITTFDLRMTSPNDDKDLDYDGNFRPDDKVLYYHVGGNRLARYELQGLMNHD